FFPMVIATVLAVLIGGVRWALGSQLVTGLPPAAPVSRSASPGNARPDPAPRRSAADDQWSADDPFADPAAKPGRNGRGGQPARRSSSSPDYTGDRPARPARDQRNDRDPWGDPRLAADRSQPPADRTRGTGPTPPPRSPGASPQRGTGPTPQRGTGSSPQPGGTGPAPQRGTGPASQPRDGGPAQQSAGGNGPTSPPRDRTPRSRPGPSWTPDSRPASRPQPPDGWTPAN
ncbi:MAG TPA: hypothetical protein VGD91_18040, partial [Trebonia sp.]